MACAYACSAIMFPSRAKHLSSSICRQSMMQGELLCRLRALLWLLLHQSRVEGERAELCWLEKWTQEARQRGARALDQLRGGVQKLLLRLGSGFLAHPANTALRDKLTAGALTKQDYFRQLLRIVYRFLFLFAAEDRDLLHLPVNNTELTSPVSRHEVQRIIFGITPSTACVASRIASAVRNMPTSGTTSASSSPG